MVFSSASITGSRNLVTAALAVTSASKEEPPHSKEAQLPPI